MAHSQIGQYTTILAGTTRYSGEVVYINEKGFRSVLTSTGAVATGPEIVTIY